VLTLHFGDAPRPRASEVVIVRILEFKGPPLPVRVLSCVSRRSPSNWCALITWTWALQQQPPLLPRLGLLRSRWWLPVPQRLPLWPRARSLSAAVQRRRRRTAGAVALPFAPATMRPPAGRLRPTPSRHERACDFEASTRPPASALPQRSCWPRARRSLSSLLQPRAARAARASTLPIQRSFGTPAARSWQSVPRSWSSELGGS